MNQKKKRKRLRYFIRGGMKGDQVLRLSYLGIGQALIIYLAHTLTVHAEVNRQLNSVQIDQVVS
jgi:hypothetical protein